MNNLLLQSITRCMFSAFLRIVRSTLHGVHCEKSVRTQCQTECLKVSKTRFQGLDTKVIALDVDGAGEVDFLCQATGEYRLLSQGLGTPGGEFVSFHTK